MEKLIEKLLNELTRIKKSPEIYEIFQELDHINLESKKEIRKFIDNYSNMEEL